MVEQSIWELMAEVLEQAAPIVTEGPSLEPIRRFEQSHAFVEGNLISDMLGSTLPVDWLAEMTGSYLAEGAGGIKALAALLRSNTMTGAFEPVVRAVFERVGRINWALEEWDPPSPRRRAIRASFEALVTSQHYRMGTDMIRADVDQRKRITKDFRDIRSQITKWFDVVQLEDPSDPSSQTSKSWLWTIEGERYPRYEDLGRWAIFDKTVDRRVTVGVYAGLSAFTHPSFIPGRELRSVNEGRFGYQYTFDYVERTIRLALFSLGDAFKHWLGYYDNDHDRLVAKFDEIVSRWEELTTRTET